MKKDNKNKDQHLSYEFMKAYLQEKLTDKEAHEVEEHLLKCAFCSEALEGLEYSLQKEDTDTSLKELDPLIDERINERKVKKIPVWAKPYRIAAAIAVLVTATYLILNSDLILNEKLTQENQPESEQSLTDTDEQNKQKVEEVEEPEESVDESTETFADTAQDPIPETKDETLAESLTSENDEKDRGAGIESKDETQDELIAMQKEEEAERKSKIQESQIDTALDEVTDEDLTITRVIPTDDKQEFMETDTKDQQVLTENNRTKKRTITAERAEAIAEPSVTATEEMTNTKIIRGKVTYTQDNTPLPGVNVILKGTTKGTITDIDGNYQIQVPDENNTLIFSFIGYSSKEVQTGDSEVINIDLEADITSLSEVVVTGYATDYVEDEIRTVIRPRPDEGRRSLKRYIRENLNYPDEAREKGIEGTVVVDFFVETNGELTDFQIVRGIGSGCDEEAVRLIKEGPPWNPGTINGSTARQKVRVRIKFEL